MKIFCRQQSVFVGNSAGTQRAKGLFERISREECGVLTMEWILVLFLLVIGIVGGLAVIRDALNIQFFEMASAAAAVDTSYEIPAYESRHKAMDTDSSNDGQLYSANAQKHSGMHGSADLQ